MMHRFIKLKKILTKFVVSLRKQLGFLNIKKCFSCVNSANFARFLEKFA